MANRIVSVQVQTVRADPTQADLTITVAPEKIVPDLELRGRLLGPRCLYAETIEIAYALRTLPDRAGALRSRVIIPEPSFWDPQSPFLYEGPVELWEAGRRMDRVQVVHGLRQLALGRSGLKLNGRSITLRGVQRSWLPAEAAVALRSSGVNLVVADTLDSESLLTAADQFGFLVLRRLDADLPPSLESLKAGGSHPSLMGWVIRPADLANLLPQLRKTAVGFIGLEITESDDLPADSGVDFLLCAKQALPALEPVALPKLIIGEALPEAVDPTAIGWITPA